MLDQIEGWAAYARLHEKETSPRRKAMLANMMAHYKWEVLGEPDRLLDGVHPDAVYSFYGLGGDAMVPGGSTRPVRAVSTDRLRVRRDAHERGSRALRPR